MDAKQNSIGVKSSIVCVEDVLARLFHDGFECARLPIMLSANENGATGRGSVMVSKQANKPTVRFSDTVSPKSVRNSDSC